MKRRARSSLPAPMRSHAGDQHGVKLTGDFDVVVLAARAVAERPEVEPDHVVGGFHTVAILRPSTRMLPWSRVAAVARRERGETLGHETVGLGAQRAVEQLRLLQQAQTVIVAAVHVHYPGMQLERFDGGQETSALQPVLVQAVGLDVGGGHPG